MLLSAIVDRAHALLNGEVLRVGALDAGVVDRSLALAAQAVVVGGIGLQFERAGCVVLGQAAAHLVLHPLPLFIGEGTRVAEVEVVRPARDVVDRHPHVAVGIAQRLRRSARPELVEGHHVVVHAHVVLFVVGQVTDARVHVAVVRVQHLESGRRGASARIGQPVWGELAVQE